MNKIIFDNLLCDTAPKRAPQKTNRNRMMRKRNDIYQIAAADGGGGDGIE